MTGGDLKNRVQDSQTIWNETHKVSGRDGEIQLSLFQGQLVFSNGEAAACAGVEVIDISDNKAPFAGQLMALLADGSISYQTFEGVVTEWESETRMSGTGSWKLTSGTGRFANLQGEGLFTWKMAGNSYHAEYAD